MARNVPELGTQPGGSCRRAQVYSSVSVLR